MAQRIKNLAVETLSKAWATLTRAEYDILRRDGKWQHHSRRSYDHGHAAAMLLINPATAHVLLTRQFRYPVHASGDSGWMLEACAGLLDDDDPTSAIIREAIEETGHRPTGVVHLYDAYMSPGSLTEKLSLFVGHYDDQTQEGTGGGLAEEGEDIEIVELGFAEALEMIQSGDIIDAKTIMLLQWAALNRPELLN
ncbi:NUDIX domain-containing protein [Devosia rhodophyticola]|uniref:GDP-mannose pyrophosphatase n=1 Tax=Devosia rhodophyticola TaxID=3026423 RepID=A0ABY7YUC7_9HYPH|nr:NUDIX domain-containing protein [Devosia rhodophyticola]WDR04455.1 NUDIX domain-containing protein [Devosia rhodophyticola]